VLPALWLSCVDRLEEEPNYDVYPASLHVSGEIDLVTSQHRGLGVAFLRDAALFETCVTLKKCMTQSTRYTAFTSHVPYLVGIGSSLFVYIQYFLWHYREWIVLLDVCTVIVTVNTSQQVLTKWEKAGMCILIVMGCKVMQS
jgi:hypothetical protein